MSSFNQTDPRKHSLALDIQRAQKLQKASPEVGNAALALIRSELGFDAVAHWWDETLTTLQKERFCRYSAKLKGFHLLRWAEFSKPDQEFLSRAIRIGGEVARTMPGGA